MKKIFTLLAMSALMLGANAQETVQGSGFWDNWSITLQGGGVAPTTNHAVFKDVRGVAGLEFTKQVTPVLGFGFQGIAGFNTMDYCSCFKNDPSQGATTIIDNINASVLGKINFSNWFGGYKGTPRCFEVEGVFGFGFLRNFGQYASNDATSTVGLNFNFNLGKQRAWSINLKPALVYNLTNNLETQYNIDRSAIQVLAGVTYHFKNPGNGAHHFTLMRAYDQAEVDGLNARINDLRGQLDGTAATLGAATARIAELEAALDECRNRKPEVKEVQVVKTDKSMEQTITFRQGKSNVEAAQLPNVERIATFMKNNKDSKVVIKGYASPEGSAEINARLAKQRAEAVKNILVNKYKIAASRIVAEGQGVGDMFSEPDWNRVSICTLEK